jgi:hypothetical protein
VVGPLHASLKIAGFVLAFAGLLASCGPVPKPFRRPDAPPAALVRASGSQGVRIGLPSGTTEPMAKLIAKAVADELTRMDIPAQTGPEGKLRYLLKADVGPGAGASPARIHWQLLEKNNELFYDFYQDVEASEWEWQLGSPKVIEQIGEETARLIADAVAPPDDTLEPTKPLARGVWVRPIEGAPGDGDVSLTRAMRFALMGADVAVTSEPDAARHQLKGEVAVGPPRDNSQSVEIRWTVLYPDGGVAGSAVQRNQVPVGTFEGRWGETASIIAAAAVPGVKDVLIRAEETVRVRMAGPGPALNTEVPEEEGQPKLPPPELSPEPELPSAQKP